MKKVTVFKSLVLASLMVCGAQAYADAVLQAQDAVSAAIEKVKSNNCKPADIQAANQAISQYIQAGGKYNYSAILQTVIVNCGSPVTSH